MPTDTSEKGLETLVVESLVQHSAGSGKSNSIAWLAHRPFHNESLHWGFYSAAIRKNY